MTASPGIDAAVANSAKADVEIQYADASDQRQTSLAGMWLFLTSETLFFSGLFLLWLYYRVLMPEGFAKGAEETWFSLGTINTLILMTASAIYACGVPAARLGYNRTVVRTGSITMVLGLLFMAVKLFEWYKDYDDHMLPGPDFGIHDQYGGQAQIFWTFYFIGTALHMIHLAIGIGLVGWITWRARQNEFRGPHAVAVEAVGLYWSFVDMVWMVLYGLIYLGSRG